jgi:UDP-N-acetylglucosamine--N-acetylmuramyl-(pentapeptide) pyrophosphoryl-undecaprenol N-acetylglucosamine transferase
VLWAALQVLAVMRRRRPGVVLGMGGFVTGPGGVAAWLSRTPLLIHEQNAVAGFTNKILAPLAQRVMEAFPGSLQGRHVLHTGNPVRRAIAELPVPEQRFASRAGRLRLLVLGGSLGARALNELVPAAVAQLASRPEVWHQCGMRHLEEAREHYRRAAVEARVEPFIEDMAAAYAWADLVLCRAGALTIAELAAAGVGAILVPYPHAVDDHQTRNAAYLAGADAAVVVQQRELTPKKLGELLLSLCGGTTESPHPGPLPEGEGVSEENLGFTRVRLAAMARAARCLARPDAAGQVAAQCLEAIRGEV